MTQGDDDMPEYRFSLIVPSGKLTHEEILEATDALGEAGCTDASIRGHVSGMELQFDREAASLQDAITSAITAVEGVGFQVAKVELEREAIPA
jgi:hypothetical protein